MAINKKLREQVYNKYNGLCAYTGLPLGEDWQVDHLIPKSTYHIYKKDWNANPDVIENLLPALKIVNHYKRGLSLKDFREWYLKGLHLRLKKLPTKSNCQKSIKRKQYLLEVARVFNISMDKPFSGKFYFESLSS